MKKKYKINGQSNGSQSNGSQSNGSQSNGVKILIGVLIIIGILIIIGGITTACRKPSNESFGSNESNGQQTSPNIQQVDNPVQLSREHNTTIPLNSTQKPIIYFDVTGQGPVNIIKGTGLNANETMITIVAPKSSVSHTFTSNINKDGINYKSLGKSDDIFKCLASTKNGKLDPDACIVKTQDKVNQQPLLQMNYPNDYEGPSTIFMYQSKPNDSVMVHGILQSVKEMESKYIITFSCFEKAELLPENVEHNKPSHTYPHIHATAHPGRIKQERGSQLPNSMTASIWSLQIYVNQVGNGGW